MGQTMKKINKGFTLIELMITVAIIGIVATLSAPYYQDYLQKSGRADATAGLQRMADLQEQYVLKLNAVEYTLDETNVGGEDTERGYYKLSVKSATAVGYTLEAVAVSTGPQANDTQNGTSCTTLTITHELKKTPAACWVK